MACTPTPGSNNAAPADAERAEFDQRYASHLRHLELEGLRPKTIEASERVNDFAAPGDVNLVCGRRVRCSAFSPQVAG